MLHIFPKGDELTASSRQRSYNVAKELQQLSYSVKVHLPYSKMLATSKRIKKYIIIHGLVKNLFYVKSKDIIFLQRTVYNMYFILLILACKFFTNAKLIFDLDDAVFLYNPKRCKLLARYADIVIAGSHAIQDWASVYNQKVFLIPTSIVLEKYSRNSIKYSIKKPVVIGWIGNAPAHFENLLLFSKILQAMSECFIYIRIKIIGTLHSEKIKNLFINIKGLQLEFVETMNWLDPLEVSKAIADFDIGVMPLEETEWNKSKCSFKAIECMACGVPVVISAVGENNHLVQNGINGFLADKAEDWISKLKLLIHNTQLREIMGKNGQQTIKENYTYLVNIPKLIALL